MNFNPFPGNNNVPIIVGRSASVESEAFEYLRLEDCSSCIVTVTEEQSSDDVAKF